jgi:hypothetical protein
LESIIVKLERYPTPHCSTLIDAVMDGYVAWREESAAVETASERSGAGQTASKAAQARPRAKRRRPDREQSGHTGQYYAS